MAQVLLVDDEPDFAGAAIEMLRHHSHEVTTVGTLAQARKEIDESPPEILLLDLMLPDGNGLELLPEVTGRQLKKIVLITGHPGIKKQIRNLSGPSISYLTKPFGGNELLQLLKETDLEQLQKPATEFTSDRHFGLMLGEHKSMRQLYKQVERVAKGNTSVFVVGETGTGKELVAEAIHRASGRTGDFVVVNCGSLPSELAGSELFGHEKGSFTGAVRHHTGYFRRAEGGTLFLDELTEMPIELQPHFLRVLETKKVMPVGADKETTIDVRVVAATNRSPEQAIAEKTLRQDMYFRLSAFPIEVPPLRERASDIELLARTFLDELQETPGQKSFSPESLERLKAYSWPGNVRELQHVVQRAFIMAESDAVEIELADRFSDPVAMSGGGGSNGVEPGRTIRDVERELIERTLTHYDGNKKLAAEALGISLNTLYNRLNSYGHSGG